MSNDAANPYLVQTDGMFDTIKKAVVGKDKHELQEQVADLKRQKKELMKVEKEFVAKLHAEAQDLEDQIYQITNPRAHV
jgi:hypothetical protein